MIMNNSVTHSFYDTIRSFGDQDFSEKIYFKLQDDGMDIVFCGNNESSESFEEALKKKYNCWSTTEHCDNPDL